MNDKMLMEMTQEVDIMLMTNAEKYGMSPLLYSSVIIARLMLFNNSNQEFKNLMLILATRDDEPLQEDEDEYDNERIVH